MGTTLAQIAGRAGVSPRLVAHYFGDKDGLLDAAFRSLARRVGDQVRARLRNIATPRARIQAIIDANLAPEEFDRRTGTAWLAFWGQVLQVPSLRRVQSVYQRRTLTNLKSSLKKLVPREEAQSLAAMIAAMIDGVWLRAALSGWREADSASARALLTEFVDRRLNAARASPDDDRATRERRTPGGSTAGPQRFASINPATGAVLGYVSVAGSADVDAAVRAAQRGQVRWAAMTGAERARVLRQAAQDPALAQPRARRARDARHRQADSGDARRRRRFRRGLLRVLRGPRAILERRAHRSGRPGIRLYAAGAVGVVAGIGAWNYPLQIACWKAAPALACGNAMIFKPAEITPFSAVKLEQILLDAGVPPGVFQVVQGFADTGRLLTRHPAIRKVSLTGEVGTGKAVMSDAASTLKSVTLELGGKSPLIVFDDAKLDNAVSGAILGNFYSSGQVCSNATRVFVHASVKTAFLERLVKRVSAMRIGDPMDPQTHVGPLVSEQHMQKVLGYIARGRTEGARVRVGGQRVTEGLSRRGSSSRRRCSTNVATTCPSCARRYSGRSCRCFTFNDEEEVIERANATEFGLSAGVFTNDLTRAHRVIARLQAGTCWINHYNITPIELPFGGVKMSGLGRENGRAAIEHYTQLKSVYVALGDVDAPY